jgi:hypothetical protein
MLAIARALPSSFARALRSPPDGRRVICRGHPFHPIIEIGSAFLVGDFLAGVSVHLGVLDTVAGLSVKLVKRDFFGLRRSRIVRYGTGDERKAQEAFPVGEMEFQFACARFA